MTTCTSDGLLPSLLETVEIATDRHFGEGQRLSVLNPDERAENLRNM